MITMWEALFIGGYVEKDGFVQHRETKNVKVCKYYFCQDYNLITLRKFKFNSAEAVQILEIIVCYCETVPRSTNNYMVNCKLICFSDPTDPKTRALTSIILDLDPRPNRSSRC